MKPRTVILTADDYGMCAAANEAIEECLERGSLTSTNVMVNMPAHAGARELRRRFPGVALGLHWTICQGRPVLPPSQVPSLVGPDAQFWPAAELRRRWKQGRLRAAELRAELLAQHRRFVGLAGAPDYWNTHQNTHVYPGLFPLFVHCGLECGMRAMRSHHRVIAPRGGNVAAVSLRHPVFVLKGLLIDLYNRWARGLRVWMPRGLVYAFGYNKHAEIAQVLSNPCLPTGHQPLEFVVHPATREEPALFGELVTSRVTEYHALRAGDFLHRLATAGVTLRTFGPMAQPKALAL